MALDKEILRAFAAVVGEANVSDDPAICENYRTAAHQSSAHYGPYYHWTPTPLAVIMPGSTKEVQGVIKLCNKYELQFKASTSFWSVHGYITSDRAVQVDMRRMCFLEIDEKNMIATVGPVVTHAQLHAEAIKHGLCCNIPGVGCSCSVVANTSGWGGPGPSSPYTGNGNENLLCMEWVLPDGRIITTGSAAMGAGWFSAEGPGPEQRGLLRGGRGLCGELGICTKMSVKLSPWAGPKTLTTVGKPPAYRVQLPDNFRYHTICFPDWDNWAGAMMALGDADIVFTGHRQFWMFGRDIKAAMLRIITDPDKQLADITALNELPEVQEHSKSIKIELNITLMGQTPEDLAWKEAALDEILTQFHGWKDAWSEEKENNEWLMTYFVRMGHKNLNYVLCGSYEGCFGLNGANLVKSAQYAEKAYALKREWEEKDTFFAKVGGDCSMGGLSSLGGAGGPMLWEFFAHFDGMDPKSVEGTRKFIAEQSSRFQAENKLGPEFCYNCAAQRKPDAHGFSQEEHNEMFVNAPQPYPMVYQWKIRELFNPNHETVSGSYYQTLDPEYLKKVRGM